jgi:hypothetical protein
MAERQKQHRGRIGKAVATPAKAFSAPGPYCIAKTPAGFPFDTRAKPSAMWTPTRSWRQITGLMPTAAAASMIGVVGKQNKVEMPSRFRISAITFITCIGHSSRLVRIVLRRIQLVQYDTSLLAFPAKAGIYFRHGHRPSPVWQDVVLCVVW